MERGFPQCSPILRATIEEPLPATLRILCKLTREHAVNAEDMRAVLAAGVSRDQIEDALAVCFSFNTIGRLADAFGSSCPVPRPSRLARSICWRAVTVDQIVESKGGTKSAKVLMPLKVHSARLPAAFGNARANFSIADNTRISLSKTLSGDPIGDGRSSPDRLFFCYPFGRLSRTSCRRMAIRGSCHAVPSLSKAAVREAPRRRSWRIDRLCRISARGTPKVGTSTSGYNTSEDPAAAEPVDGAACS